MIERVVVRRRPVVGLSEYAAEAAQVPDSVRQHFPALLPGTVPVWEGVNGIAG